MYQNPGGVVAIVLVLAAMGPAVADPVPESDVTEDEQRLRAAQVAIDGPGLLAFFRSRTLDGDRQERVAALIHQLGDRAFFARERASAALVQIGPPALSALRKALHTSDIEVRMRAARCIEIIQRQAQEGVTAAAVRVLCARRPAEATAVLLAYLPFADDEWVEQEILYHLPGIARRQGRLDPVLHDALKDALPVRRGAAGLVLGQSAEPDDVRAVRHLLTDGEPLVRFRAAQGLLAGGDRQAVPVLLALLADAPLPVAEQAEALLTRLAGEQAPNATLGTTAADRRRCAEAWNAWWQDGKVAIDWQKTPQLLLVNPAALAREHVLKFFRGVHDGDFNTLKKTTGLPFYLPTWQVIRTQAELDTLLAELAKESKERGLRLVVTHVVSGADFLKAADPKVRTFLVDLEKQKGNFQAVYIRLDPDREQGALLVRVRGSHAQVIGYAQGGPPQKKAP